MATFIELNSGPLRGISFCFSSKTLANFNAGRFSRTWTLLSVRNTNPKINQLFWSTTGVPGLAVTDKHSETIRNCCHRYSNMENSQAWVVLLLYALINHIVTKVSHQNVPHFKLTFTIALGVDVSFIYRSFPYKYSVLAPPPTKRLDNLASRSVFWIWLCLSMTPCIPPFTMQDLRNWLSVTDQ